MRKIFIFLFLALIGLFGCAKNNSKEKLVVNPIMPIHYKGDTMTFYLTDYLPYLETGDKVTLLTDTHYQCQPKENHNYILSGDNTLSVLRVQTSTEQVDIPILPHCDVIPALTTLNGGKGFVTIGRTDSTTDIQIEKIVCLLQNKVIPSENIISTSPNDPMPTWRIRIDDNASAERRFLRVYAYGRNTNGEFLTNDILVPLEGNLPIRDAGQLCRHDDQSQVLYSVLVDRFCNGNPQNDWKLNSDEVLDVVDYQGGDLAGITQKIQDGYFDSLGVTTLWISPITQNPWDAWGCYRFQPAETEALYQNKYDPTKAYTRFSGYHGYWPIYATAIDRRLGTENELKTLLSTAHGHNMNVILDYVANHMHIASPTLQAHPDWHTDSILPDGRRNFELWDEARLTTWFDVHIPTLDLEREDVYQPMTDSALYWLENFELDGFRHDACKHIPECYWRTLTHKAVTRFPQRHIWMIGETYGSPELINTYVKTGMLNAQFDFNVYFTSLTALAGRCPMQEINRVILESAATYGSHHTMGNISGNHDQARCASVLGGAILPSEDIKEAGWTREVGYGNKEQALRKALMLEMLNMTIPGVPCVYQGDEYAEAGGNDPDNRHTMRFEGYDKEQVDFNNKVQQLIRLRRHSMPLLYGDYIPVYADENTLIYQRSYMGETVTVTLHREGECSISNQETVVWSL